jgi:hypothetical protein
MRKTAGFLLICILLLAGCNLPTKPTAATPTPDLIATQVSVMLTKMPTATMAPSGTAAPIATIAPSATTPSKATPTQATPSETPTLSPTPGDLPDWRESFDGGKSFYLFENDNTKARLDGGALVLTGITANGWLGWSLTYSQKPQNFRLEATFQTETCSGTDLYGLVFRAPDANSGYFYGVSCDGRINLHARNFTDGTDIEIVALTGANQVTAGSNQTNQLGVNVSGSKIQLFANGLMVQEVNDETFKDAGFFGAFIAANETTGFTVRMDEISLWKLP